MRNVLSYFGLVCVMEWVFGILFVNNTLMYNLRDMHLVETLGSQTVHCLHEQQPRTTNSMLRHTKVLSLMARPDWNLEYSRGVTNVNSCQMFLTKNLAMIVK